MHPNQIHCHGSTVIFVPKPTPLASPRGTDHKILVDKGESSSSSQTVQSVSPAQAHHSGTGTTTSPKSPGRSTNADLQDSSSALLYSPAHKGATRHPAVCFGELLREEETNNWTTKAKIGQSQGLQLPAGINSTCRQHRAGAKRLSPVILTFIPWPVSSKKSSEKQYSCVSQFWHSWLYYNLQFSSRLSSIQLTNPSFSCLASLSTLQAHHTPMGLP